MKALAVGIFCLVSLVPVSRAETVKVVHDDGALELAGGNLVTLAGLEFPEESRRLFPVLLAGKDVEVQPDSAPAPAGVPAPVYLYVNTSEIDMPFPQGLVPHEQKVMVNELFLALGAARVSPEKVFDQRESFLRIEAAARTRGEGIWSYEENFDAAPEAAAQPVS